MGFIGWKLAGVFGYNDGVESQDDGVVMREEVEGGAVLVTGFVRRVEEDNVGGAFVLHHGVQQLADAAIFNGVATLQFERSYVRADGGGGFGFALGEPAELRATAESFNADRAGAGVEIGKFGACNPRGEDVEEGLPEPVASGTGFEALGGLEYSGAVGSGYDTHPFEDTAEQAASLPAYNERHASFVDPAWQVSWY